YFPNEADRKAIIDRATALRGGTVVGDGIDPVRRRDLLDDVLRVFADTSRTRLQWEELADLLAAHEPDTYADVTGEAISAALRTQDDGEPVGGRRPGEGRTRRGGDRAGVLAAAERRAIAGGSKWVGAAVPVGAAARPPPRPRRHAS